MALGTGFRICFFLGGGLGFRLGVGSSLGLRVLRPDLGARAWRLEFDVEVSSRKEDLAGAGRAQCCPGLRSPYLEVQIKTSVGSPSIPEFPAREPWAALQ